MRRSGSLPGWRTVGCRLRPGDVWGLDKNGWTPLYSYDEDPSEEELQEKFGPYTIVWEPKEDTSE